MGLLGLDKKATKLILKIIDETIGKKFPAIDKLTDLFQENDAKLKKIDEKINSLEEKSHEPQNYKEKCEELEKRIEKIEANLKE